MTKFFDTSTLDHDMLLKITRAQLAHMSEISSSEHWLYSDDSMDYLNSAISLSQELLVMLDESQSDPQPTQTKSPGLINAAKLLDTGLWQYACDGICSFIYDLKPISLDDKFEPPADPDERTAEILKRSH